MKISEYSNEKLAWIVAGTRDAQAHGVATVYNKNLPREAARCEKRLIRLVGAQKAAEMIATEYAKFTGNTNKTA